MIVLVDADTLEVEERHRQLRESIEFIIDYDGRPGESGQLYAIGTCGDRPIRVGDVFTEAFRYKPRRYPDEIAEPAERQDERPVHLTVKHIQAYGRCLDQLGPGMTASLVLEGSGDQYVAAGWVLGASAVESASV